MFLCEKLQVQYGTEHIKLRIVEMNVTILASFVPHVHSCD